mmetsp:Transcript_63359/g.151180  ORF Transcript_63359/g.151180 Transcript_63359/m.151180 type:complete len:292 (-) Transcript_63359:1224-2099(-)
MAAIRSVFSQRGTSSEALLLSSSTVLPTTMGICSLCRWVCFCDDCCRCWSSARIGSSKVACLAPLPEVDCCTSTPAVDFVPTFLRGCGAATESDSVWSCSACSLASYSARKSSISLWCASRSGPRLWRSSRRMCITGRSCCRITFCIFCTGERRSGGTLRFLGPGCGCFKRVISRSLVPACHAAMLASSAPPLEPCGLVTTTPVTAVSWRLSRDCCCCNLPWRRLASWDVCSASLAYEASNSLKMASSSCAASLTSPPCCNSFTFCCATSRLRALATRRAWNCSLGATAVS